MEPGWLEPQGMYLGLSPAALRPQVQKPSWPGCRRRLRVRAGVSSEPRTLSPVPQEHLFSQLIKGNCIGVIFLPSTYSLSKGLAEPGGSREAPERWPGLESMVPTHSSPAAIILHHVVGSDGGWGLHVSEFRPPVDRYPTCCPLPKTPVGMRV